MRIAFPEYQEGPQMSMWDQAADAAIEAQDDIDKSGSPATPDQKIALAQVEQCLKPVDEREGRTFPVIE